MPLINRFSRLLQADLHAVLDRLEEPEALLRQAIREMDELVHEDQSRARRAALERTHIETALRDATEVLARVESELDVCFEAGAEDLARTLVKRKLELTHAVQVRRQRLSAVQQEIDALDARIPENTARLESMRANADALGPQPDAPQGHASTWMGPDLGGLTTADVEVAFLSEKRKRGAA